MDSRETKSSNRNEKKTIKNKPQTGNAASEAPPGAERPLCFISPCQSMPIRAISSVKFPPILVRNFYVKNGEFLRNFYVEIASGYCQLIGILRPIRQTDRLSLLLITTAHKTGGTRTHFGLVLVCLIDTVKLGVGKQVSEWETRGQNGNSAEIWMAIVYWQNNGWNTTKNMLFGKERKKGQKDAFFKGIKKGGESIK